MKPAYEKKVRDQIGSKLKAFRIKQGYKSHEDFATANKLSRVQVWKIESGNANITLSTLLRMLEIHKLTLKEFFKDIDG